MASTNPLKSILNFFYPEEEEEEFESQEPVAPPPVQEPQQKRTQRGPLLLRSGNDGGMEIRHPRSLDERMMVGMDLKHRRMVTLDLTRLSDAEARYFLEFIYGVVFALDATAEKVNDGIYLLAPHGVSVRNDAEDEPAPAKAGARTSTSSRDRQQEQEELFWQGG